MKVVHVTTIDEGGAYKATCRIHHSLQLQNIESTIILRTKKNSNSIGKSCFTEKKQEFYSKAKNGLNLLWKRKTIYRDILGTDISKHPNIQEADVIILHWINSFLSYKNLKQIFQLGKPVLWVLHDMWPLTGGCHYDEYCNKFVTKCGECPLIESKNKKDITFKNFNDKKLIYESYSFSLVGPSKWSVEMAKNSSLLREKKVYYIPNCIDINTFKRTKDDKISSLREKYNIFPDKKIVLFGAAHDGVKNRLKGFSYLLNALSLLDDSFYLVVFGNATDDDLKGVHQEYKLLGYIQDEAEMAEIYAMADVFVAPSIQEAFGFTACEAMACGTPVVGFAVGGLCDQIEHMRNGYLAKLKDFGDLAEGIKICAENSEAFGEKAHKAALRFSLNELGMQYVAVLNELVKEKT